MSDDPYPKYADRCGAHHDCSEAIYCRCASLCRPHINPHVCGCGHTWRTGDVPANDGSEA